MHGNDDVIMYYDHLLEFHFHISDLTKYLHKIHNQLLEVYNRSLGSLELEASVDQLDIRYKHFLYFQLLLEK